MRKILSVCGLASLWFASIARADLLYSFSVDTSGISGTAGSLDLQFNPGPLVTQPASLQILNFSGDGTLVGAPVLTGDVSGGPLPAALTFDNGTAFNDYFEGFIFGSNLSFAVRLFGPAVASPDGTSTSGSTFAFSMFSDAAGTVPALTSDTTDGFAALIDLNLDGTGAPTNFSAPTTVTPEPPPSPVPEPSGLGMLSVAVLGVACLRRSRDRTAGSR
ncbi:MAG TPA: NF038129 family PEP-CTERM protein [Bryobacteraceae bacterium]|nr:NF038129 family PEP-CTERM protein [Bryobacteraceae bacterium]